MLSMQVSVQRCRAIQSMAESGRRWARITGRGQPFQILLLTRPMSPLTLCKRYCLLSSAAISRVALTSLRTLSWGPGLLPRELTQKEMRSSGTGQDVTGKTEGELESVCFCHRLGSELPECKVSAHRSLTLPIQLFLQMFMWLEGQLIFLAVA